MSHSAFLIFGVQLKQEVVQSDHALRHMLDFGDTVDGCEIVECGNDSKPIYFLAVAADIINAIWYAPIEVNWQDMTYSPQRDASLSGFIAKYQLHDATIGNEGWYLCCRRE